jgi:iron complex outermembrane receptor protein
MNTKMKNRLAVATAIALGSAAPGFAQSTTAQAETAESLVELEAFEVTGSFAGSLAAAAEIKQNAPVIIEVISAEDIGKLPDTSIAESLARLPGLTTQRINSRAQAIVIRGMTGDFSTGLLNGREQVSTGSGRAVEFDQYPAELLSGVVVYKTADASLVGQGLAGTVDLRTVRPIQHDKRTVAMNATYEWSDLGKLNAGSKDTGLNYSFSYIDQFADGKLGVAIGYAHTDKPGQGEQWNAWGYPNVDAGTSPGAPFVLGGAKPFVRSSELERDGIMAVVEYRPNANFHSTLDIYTSDFNETQLLRGIEIPLFWSSAQLQPGFTVDDGLITNVRFNNIFGVVRNDIVTRDADVFAGGWNLEFGNADGWMVVADLGYSKIKRKDFVLETYSGFGSNQVGTADSMLVSLESGTGAIFTPTLDYTNAAAMRLTSPQGWGGDVVSGGQVGFLKGPRAEDELTQIKVLAKRKMDGFFSSFESGLAHTKRTKDEVEAGPGGTEGFFLSLPNGQTSAPLPTLQSNTSLSFIGIPGMISYDPLALYNSGFYTLTPNPNPNYVSENWDVEEKVTLGYAQVGIDREIGSIPVSGSLGFQLMFSDQTSAGLAADGTSITPVEESHDYVDFLPSLNLNFRLGDGKFLRFSAARQLARQTMRDMRAGSTFSYNESLAGSTDPTQSPWSGSGGNPKLEPWRSNSFDLSFENYFKDGMGYWAVGAFFKDLVSYTYTQNTIVDFTGLPTGGSTTTPAIFQGLRSIPANGSGGNVRGIEVTLSLPGEKFSDALKGFGLIVGGAYVQSSIQPDLGNPETPIPGLSEKVLSTTLYYERKGFAARLSSRYRSDYRGDIATFGPRGAVFRNLQAETVLDAQISYAFSDGPMKGFTVLAQAYNLTDEPLFATQGYDTRLVQDYQRYGAQYSVGVSYKF